MTAQLNENNIWLTREAVEEMLRRLQIHDFAIHNLEIYQKAFVHKSYVRKIIGETPENVIPFQLESNEVLEFEGDSILGGYVARYLHHRYPLEQEGFLTTLKSRLVKTESLSRFATFLGFGKYLIISKYVEEQGGRENPKLLENTFEAFVGACYRDNGGLMHDPLSLLLPHRFLRNIMEMTVNFGELNQVDDNYKDQLMRAFHQHFKGRHATYRLLKTEGQTNNCTFTCGVQHPLYPEVIVSQAKGKKKPLAEQAAAKIALEKLDWIINYRNNATDATCQEIGDYDGEIADITSPPPTPTKPMDQSDTSEPKVIGPEVTEPKAIPRVTGTTEPRVRAPRVMETGYQRRPIGTNNTGTGYIPKKNWDSNQPNGYQHRQNDTNTHTHTQYGNRIQQKYNRRADTGYPQRNARPNAGYNGQYSRRNSDQPDRPASNGYRAPPRNEFAPDEDYYLYND